MSNWTKAEENKLMELVDYPTKTNWKGVSLNFDDKTVRACKSKYWKLKNNYKYKPKRQEDEADRSGAHWSLTEVGTIVSLIASKKSAKEISKIMNRSLETVLVKMKQLQKNTKQGFGL